MAGSLGKTGFAKYDDAATELARINPEKAERMRARFNEIKMGAAPGGEQPTKNSTNTYNP